MRDYWLTQFALSAIGWGYLLLAVMAIALAAWLPTGRVAKGICLAVVLGVASILPIRAYQQFLQQQGVVNEHKQRYAKAKTLFDERCKTAGEKIYLTVEGVDGVFVIKPRTEEVNYGQQFKLDDPYGYAGRGDNYLRLFIRGRPTVPVNVGEPIASANVVTYRYVEVADESGKGFYRYTTSMQKEESERITRNGGGVVPLVRTQASVRTARYGITWDDISTQVDRESWIAGSSQKIIDLQRNEVLAERIGYMFDSGLGNSSGGRSPWSAARVNACPPLNEKTFYFFDRVIRPINELTK